jgi:hypothetical protein
MSKSVQRIVFYAFGIVFILAIVALAYFYNPASLVSTPQNGKSIRILNGQTFGQVVQDIASSEQKSIEWIECTEELKRTPIEPGDISADDTQRLIESAGKRTPNSSQINRIILDDRGHMYEIHCK